MLLVKDPFKRGILCYPDPIDSRNRLYRNRGAAAAGQSPGSVRSEKPLYQSDEKKVSIGECFISR